MTCIMFSMFPLYTSCFETFYHKWMLDCSNAFSASIEISVQILSFILLFWCNMLIDLWV